MNPPGRLVVPWFTLCIGRIPEPQATDIAATEMHLNEFQWPRDGLSTSRVGRERRADKWGKSRKKSRGNRVKKPRREAKPGRNPEYLFPEDLESRCGDGKLRSTGRT